MKRGRGLLNEPILWNWTAKDGAMVNPPVIGSGGVEQGCQKVSPLERPRVNLTGINKSSNPRIQPATRRSAGRAAEKGADPGCSGLLSGCSLASPAALWLLCAAPCCCSPCCCSAPLRSPLRARRGLQDALRSSPRSFGVPPAAPWQCELLSRRRLQQVSLRKLVSGVLHLTETCEHPVVWLDSRVWEKMEERDEKIPATTTGRRWEPL